MEGLQFEQYCNCYEFGKDELKNYLNLQTKLMNIYLYDARLEGDNRDKNIILAEWISIHSKWFKYMWFVLKKGICND